MSRTSDKAARKAAKRERLERIREMRAKRLRLVDIAAAEGLSVSRLAVIIRQHGIGKPAKPPPSPGTYHLGRGAAYAELNKRFPRFT